VNADPVQHVQDHQDRDRHADRDDDVLDLLRDRLVAIRAMTARLPRW
jgi:hypothetical protein